MSSAKNAAEIWLLNMDLTVDFWHVPVSRNVGIPSPILKRYVDGGTVRQFQFAFTSKDKFDGSALTGIENSEPASCAMLNALVKYCNSDEFNPSGKLTLEEFKNYLETNNLVIQVVAKLATPQTYQLTPTEVLALLGNNNVFSDTGDTEVTYKAKP